MAIERNKCH